MNKLLVFAFTLFIGVSAFGQNDPVIMTINGKGITKSEFLQIYLKNNNDPKYDKQSLDEYMELFKKFKLKVAEAEALGYDTIPKLVKELNGYKKQLALPYLIDSAQNESLVKEAYNRTNTEVRASHIMLKLAPNATPEDTLRLYNRLLDMKKRIENGEDFVKVATGKGGSEDPSVSTNGGDLGYFTAFQMVYPFEEMAYTTPVGKVSMPFRTRFGYHILKVTDKRAAKGTIETAHIMVAVGKSSSQDGDIAARAKIDEIYGLLEKGENFEELVAKYSDDPTSNKKNGVLPAFGTGTTTRMVPEFEEAAFALQHDGDYSKPVKTNYGYHIVKRVSLKPVPSFEEMKDGLESKVAKDERSKTTQSSFVKKLKVEYGFSDKSGKPLKWFYSNIDSSYFLGKFDPSTLTSDKPLFMLDGKKFSQKQFANYLKTNYRALSSGDSKSVVDEQYKRWVKDAILEYEESKLVDKYPAFKALVTEYHDGILLYEVMSDMVWNKAMKDTTGLKDFYKSHTDKYVWGKRADADVYECYSKESAEKAYAMLKNDTISPTTVVNAINGNSELNIRYRNGKFDIEKTTYLTNAKLSNGLNTPYEADGKFYVLKVAQLLEPSPKEFGEAKGAITSDYQNFLEKKWLEELAAKHKVTVNSEALYSIGN